MLSSSFRQALLISALAVSTVAFPKESPLVFMGDDDPAMKRAFDKARTTLDDFLKLATKAPANLDLFSVKVGISDGKNTEYFWIGDFRRRNDRFVGRIDNTPQMVRSVQEGQVYEFTRAQIVDWMYRDRPKSKMVGNFTLCAILSKESPAKAAAERKLYNLECD